MVDLESEKFQTPNGSKTKRVGHLSHSTKKTTNQLDRSNKRDGLLKQKPPTSLPGLFLIMISVSFKNYPAPSGV